MPKFISVYNDGFCEEAEIIEAENESDAEIDTYRMLVERANIGISIEIIEFNEENCEDHSLDYEEEKNV